MNVAKNLEQNLHDFLRMMIELANSGENEAFSDEKQAIILLNSLPDTYKEVESAIKYGRTSITPEETVSTSRSKELELKTEKLSLSSSNGENYYPTGRPQQKGNGNKGRGKSKSIGRSNSKEPEKRDA